MNLCICSPGVVKLVRTNLAPDFPLFHDYGPLYVNTGLVIPEMIGWFYRELAIFDYCIKDGKLKGPISITNLKI